MKNVGAVRHQLKQVRFRHLKKRLEVELRKMPHNCRYNRTLNHPHSGEPCAVCIHPDQEGGLLCDLSWGGYERAKACPLFKHKADKEEIKEGFLEWLATAKLHEIAVEYPDMAALMWVLQEEAPNRDVEIPEDEDWEPDEEEEFPVEVSGVSLLAQSADDASQVKEHLANLHSDLDNATKSSQTKALLLEQEQKETDNLRSQIEDLERQVPDVAPPKGIWGWVRGFFS